MCALSLALAVPPVAHAWQDAAGESSAKTPSAAAPTKKPNSSADAGGSKSAVPAHHISASGRHYSSRRKKTVKARGQQKIDTERAQAIQEALIREHYLTGDATGKWNQATEDALRRYQSDHGWQSKTVPDSRALIKLGLGPSHDHLLNPESAMTTSPDSPRAAAVTPTSHTADPASHTNTNTNPPVDPTPAATPAAGSTTDPAHPQ